VGSEPRLCRVGERRSRSRPDCRGRVAKDSAASVRHSSQNTDSPEPPFSLRQENCGVNSAVNKSQGVRWSNLPGAHRALSTTSVRSWKEEHSGRTSLLAKDQVGDFLAVSW
jgi:hypothetical protein